MFKSARIRDDCISDPPELVVGTPPYCRSFILFLNHF